MSKTLIVIVGPTAIGKTALSIQLAQHYNTEVISADSRQFYQEMLVGTARPTLEEMEGVPHHMVGHLSVETDFSAGKFETAALKILEEKFKEQDVMVAVGGSGLYIDALCQGIDDIPKDMDIRNRLMDQAEKNGLEELLAYLKEHDPDHYQKVDHTNTQRVIRAVEVHQTTGKTYTEYRTNTVKNRPFNIVKVGLLMDREDLYDRINLRVDIMMDSGLLEEARRLHPLKHINSLKTVGYREFFDFFEGQYDLEEAIRLVKRNSRRYAKRQITWFKRDTTIHWFMPTELQEVIKTVDKQL